MKFLFTCGGTAGHINPAIGVAAYLKRQVPGAEILFIGAKGRMETELVPREGFEIRTIEIDNISRSLSLAGLKHNLHTARCLLRGSAEARAILKEFRPDVAVGTGGYVCYPVLRAAHAQGVPTLVHESNAVPGLTTKLLARFADCVMLGFSGAAENYPRRARTEYTGIPVREEFQRLDRDSARRALGIPPDRPLLVSVWGSLGSGHINGLMPEFMELAARRRDFDLIHSAGKRYYKELSEQAEKRCGGDLLSRGIDLREYIYDMPAVMAAADLIMCRSGASTLGELAALGKPALLVPSPNVTNNHQEKNARLLERAGAARVLLEGQFDAGGLYDAAWALLRDSAARDAMSKAMRAAAAPDATERIAKRILGTISK
ncbi:MAG: UDP-N-acetylglucosamine--N-acetylmuramyl-(pentapeptide) pyrophosphoryl-undecaprenol N-acetylglucosamine transferase [Oscillospiraceae bacterium]|nr:UDP-N-acetylglucosamine--N-acetylmuramyl-(pentapeptide) pyrophosphoryl-undecaprenol N-acetylglucosamine transferase [Oscillospiraceae bacterium]